MDSARDISRHYTRGDLLARLNGALADDGIDPRQPSIESLAPYDQFHGRGLEATTDIADLLDIRADDHVLDIGSGIGGPARYFASRFGCRVTGIDLTAEFCRVGQHLTCLLGMQTRVQLVLGNALAMPFANSSFEGAYSMNVSMNIADKGAFYGQIHRVLKPGAWLALSEIAKGPGEDPEYPTPWASTAQDSFLSTPEQTRSGLLRAGIEIIHFQSVRERALDFGARSRAMVDRGEKPPHRAVTLIHGEMAARAIANTARALSESRIVPIEVIGRRRP
jgi:SAM-dependent methyltransferase